MKRHPTGTTAWLGPLLLIIGAFAGLLLVIYYSFSWFFTCTQRGTGASVDASSSQAAWCGRISTSGGIALIGLALGFGIFASFLVLQSGKTRSWGWLTVASLPLLAPWISYSVLNLPSDRCSPLQVQAELDWKQEGRVGPRPADCGG